MAMLHLAPRFIQRTTQLSTPRISAARFGTWARFAKQPAAAPARAPLGQAWSRHASQAAAPGAASPATHRGVAWWLFGTAGAVAGMIVLGGMTRLTRSGLSMVDWKLTGSALPSSQAAWEAEFEKYKQFPEYRMVNSTMTVDEFKFIYFMEWFHRMWGRSLGVIFMAPGAYFLAKGAIPRQARLPVALAGALGAAQGAIGWWMVKSGLVERDPADRSVPRVSAYRLTAHLAAAFSIYSLLLWGGMSSLYPRGEIGPAAARAVSKVRPVAAAAAGIAALTAVSGGFVAGNDAGRAYNDWPLMAGKFVPEQYWDGKLGSRNLFENTATVQFDHRMLAYSTLAGVMTMFIKARRAPWADLPQQARAGIMAAHIAVWGQITLGVSTLMMYVPVSLGSMHQAGALALWSTMLWSLHGLGRGLPPTAAVATLGTAAAGAAAAAAVAGGVAQIGM